MTAELCKYILNKATDRLCWQAGGVGFGYMILVSQRDPFSEGTESKESAEGRIVFLLLMGHLERNLLI